MIKKTPNLNLADIHQKIEQYVPSPIATKVIYEELHSHTSRKDCTCPLHVLLAAQCPLQTSAITQLHARHIHTAVPVPRSA